MSLPKLFTPIQIGNATLKHRVVMAPLTRFRANAKHVPTALMKEYYTQRASTPGTLIISEAAFIAPQAGGGPHVPEIYTDEQVTAWKEITDEVHAKGSYIYLQIAATGRTAFPQILEAEGPFPFVSSSDVAVSPGTIKPRPLTIQEIKEFINLYATAAKNAIRAGFDGVEIHGGSGHLIDQFTQDVANKRTDEYGGSIEGRTRFALEVVDAVCNAIGENITALKLSPWSDTNDMGMDNPRPTFAHLVTELAAKHPSLAYLHLVEPRVSGHEDRQPLKDESNDFLREIWKPRPCISAGGYTRESAIHSAETKGELIAFGRLFISNPDLPARLQNNIPAYKGDRSTYYAFENPVGYIDYPFADGEVKPKRSEV